MGQFHGHPCEQESTFYDKSLNMSIETDISVRQPYWVNESPEFELKTVMSEL